MNAKHLLAASVALSFIGIASTASAWTCTHQDWKASECCPLHPTDPYCQPQGQNQQQGQQQGQGQGQIATGGNARATGGSATGGDVRNSGNSENTNVAEGGKGGKSSSTSSVGDVSNGGNTTESSADGSGNADVDLSDHSVNNNSAVFIPSVVPPTPSALLGVGQVSTVVGNCGPLQMIVHTVVNGQYMGFFRTKDVPLGDDDQLAPYVDANGQIQQYIQSKQPNGDTILLGSQPIFFATVVGVAGGRNLALGGGGSSSWGQVGGGASSSFQRLVTWIQLNTCIAGTLTSTPVPMLGKRIRQ